MHDYADCSLAHDVFSNNENEVAVILHDKVHAHPATPFCCTNFGMPSVKPLAYPGLV